MYKFKANLGHADRLIKTVLIGGNLTTREIRELKATDLGLLYPDMTKLGCEEFRDEFEKYLKDTGIIMLKADGHPITSYEQRG